MPLFYKAKASERLHTKGENALVYFIVEVYGINGVRNGQYDEYIRLARPIVERNGGRYLIRSQTIVSLSFKWHPERVIVIEFESKEQLEACFGSKEYKEIINKRIESVDARAIIVEGIENAN